MNQRTLARRSRLFAVMLVALVLAPAAIVGRPLSPHPANAAIPGANGKIVFASTRDGNHEIYIMNPDGTSQVRLTNEPSSDYQPALSPDGARIAFVSSRDGGSDIYVMDTDGSNQTRLTFINDFRITILGPPTWSPDGSKIAFSHEPYGGILGLAAIYVIDVDGSNEVRLTSDSDGVNRDPDWSPDGTEIAFSSNRSGGPYSIYVMNTDGSNPTNLTPNAGHNGHPNWSPDGSQIVFSSNRDGSSGQIYVMNADGSDPTRLTNDQGGTPAMPAWSPDGSQIAYSRFPPLGQSTVVPEIYVMGADGSNPTNVTNNPWSDEWPDWGPLPAGGPGNSPPSVAADQTSVTVDEGQTATATGSFSDADGDPVTLTASAGTLTQTGTSSGTWSWELATTDGPDDSQSVTISADDGNGGSDLAGFNLVVANVGPGILPASNQTTDEDVAAPIDLGVFEDPGADGPWQITVTWGDGTSEIFFADASGALGARTHTWSQPGLYSVLVVVSDGSDTVGAGFLVGVFEATEIDTTPPELFVPDGIVVNAVDPAGAVVDYDVAATDDVTSEPVVICEPASASIFPIGPTTVTCTATDEAGNQASADFTVHVKGALEQLSDLRAAISETPMRVSTRKILLGTVDTAVHLVESGYDTAACVVLRTLELGLRYWPDRAFQAADRQTMLADTKRIRAVLGCH